MKVLKPTPYVAEGPQPLFREIPTGESYPVEALGSLRKVVEAVQETTEAPVAIAAQSALSVASLAVQGHADVQTLAGYSPTTLYCLTVAQSGERKSACDKLIMSRVREIEKSRMTDYREQMAVWETAQKLWAAKHDRLIKDASGRVPNKVLEAEADLAKLGPAPKPPQLPKIITSEPTLEGLIKLYMTGQPSLGLFSDEGGGFLGGHAMNADNRLKTIAGLSSLWGGDSLDRVRAGDGATTLYGRRLSMHLMVQPVAARPLLSDPIASGQGFLARFLIVEPTSAIGTRLGGPVSETARISIAAASEQLAAVLAHPLPVNENCPQELEPRALNLSRDARKLLAGYYRSTELEQAPGGELEQVKSFASKSPEQAARIAGVLTLWQDIDAVSVSAETMIDAIELAQFYLSEAKRLAETANVPVDLERAEKLLRWILDVWPNVALGMGRDPETIVPRDVVWKGPNSLRDAVLVKKLMGLLEQHGWLVQLEKHSVVDGEARRLAYKIVRDV